MGLPEISSQEYAAVSLGIVATSAEQPTQSEPVSTDEEQRGAAIISDSRLEAPAAVADAIPQAMMSPSVNVMLPLTTVSSDGKLADVDGLSQKLDRLKDAGVDGFMVDVWWGLTEKQPKVYDFSAYQKLVQLAEQRGMKVQFVASFHRCGGNVGDECDIPLPPFVRQNSDIWYTDRAGHQNQEYISLFADNVSLHDGRTPLDMYGDWMTALAANFSSKLGSTISEIQVGMGPCGELRYPSYVPANGWSFCGIGEFQVYDAHARASLGAAGKSKGWTSPPSDAGSYNSRPGDSGVSFFQNGYKSEYGRFFLDWYLGALKSHGAQVLQRAKAAFQNKVPLAGKVAGIHWWYGSDSHAAEVTAGYYNTNGRDAYAEIAEVFRSSGNAALDFTCLEMRNQEQSAECQARPEDLVGQVVNAARTKGVYFNGENALQRYDSAAYDQLLRRKGDLHAFTYLRLDQKLVTDGFDAFKAFVQRMHQASQTLFV